MYLEDIIIFSKTFDEHIRHVKNILEVLQEAGISLKLSKSHFLTKSVDYLRHTIRPGLLEVATKKTAAIEDFKEPKTQNQLRSFLGLCNVYRRFVPNFARVAPPLNNILQKAFDFKFPPFGEDQSKDFDLLKRALMQPPILELPRTGSKLSVHTDACDY